LPQADGTAGEALVYTDQWGSETRLLANTFFAAGTSQVGAGPSQAATHIQHYEEGGVYVRARGTELEQMYTAAGAVTQFTRDYVYLRPGTFVVYDRTTVAAGTADQWTAWHTPTVPTAVPTTDPTQTRYDISASGAVIGSVRSLLPKGAASKVVNVLGTVSRIENHAPSPASATDWLTVVSAGANVPEQVRLSAADGNVTSGAAVGVLVLGARNSVVLFSSCSAARRRHLPGRPDGGRRSRAHRHRSVDERLCDLRTRLGRSHCRGSDARRVVSAYREWNAELCRRARRNRHRVGARGWE